MKSENEVAQSCLTPSDPMDCSLPGSSAHEIFQARVLEWVAIAFSVGSYLCTETGKLSLKAEVYWECSGGGFLGASGFLQGILVASRGREGGQVMNRFFTSQAHAFTLLIVTFIKKCLRYLIPHCNIQHVRPSWVWVRLCEVFMGRKRPRGKFKID